MATGPLIERIRRHPSPRIRAQLEAAGLGPDRFGLEDLTRLEPIAPSSLDLDRIADPVAELRLGDAPSPVRLGTCVRGEVTIVLTWTAGDLTRQSAAGARALTLAGVRAGMKVANTLEGGFSTPGSLLLGDALEALGALDVPLGPVRDARLAASTLDLLHRIEVEVLVLDSASTSLLAGIRDRPLRSLVGILWLGAGMPAGLPGWQRRWLSVPEASAFAGMECPLGSIHLAPGLIAETADGRLLLTALEGDSPVLRFDTELRGRLRPAGCGCGADGPRFEAEEAKVNSGA